ncbi:hypothetical protein ACSYAY_01210 [Leptospirillum ferriphilum]|uniref:Uncharacterized protein n=1 Tax=Leptospirillum ferriphilum TaxID=178606 RepID=A0A1V3SVC4_9BACT|nr:hypothetical protein [Leptospirillum ferriphilum]OOH72779.1 hypothetical protein BOX24_05165 [Leptospirillum ferriphilum]
MNNFQSFDDRDNGAMLTGVLAGCLSGSGAFLVVIKEWWAWGWGPGGWSWSDIAHAYWLAFAGHLFPSYKGDLGTWNAFREWLRLRHQYDAFTASFWVPFLIGLSVGLAVGWIVVRAVNRKGASYIRGAKFN